jgi:hypothetical protein
MREAVRLSHPQQYNFDSRLVSDEGILYIVAPAKRVRFWCCETQKLKRSGPVTAEVDDDVGFDAKLHGEKRK